MGDFNINLLNCNTDKDTSDYIDTLYSHSFYPTINSPTRITPTSKTLIDNIFYNNASNNIISGNIATSISDHLTQFLLVPRQLTGVQQHKVKEKRSFCNFDSKAFEKDVENIDWNRTLQIPSGNPNLSFQLFLSKIDNLLDKHCPLKKPSKRKLRTKSKPWITPALSNSIKIKNKLYKQFCKTTNPESRKQLHESFKNYRNLTITLTRISKEKYYKSFFEDNKKDSKKVWEGIRSIINVKNEKSSNNISLNIDNETITDDLTISNHFNNFFTSVAKNLVNKIPKTPKSFDSYLKNSNTNSFFITYNKGRH